MARFPHLSPAPDPHDPYELADPGYSINNFYTQASADSAATRARISNVHLSEIAALIARQEIPEYKTVHDFVRDAIHHRLHWVQKNHRTNLSAEKLLIERIRSTTADVLQATASKESLLPHIREAWQSAIRARDRKACEQLIADAEALVVEELNDPFQVDLKTLLDRMKTEMEGM